MHTDDRTGEKASFMQEASAMLDRIAREQKARALLERAPPKSYLFVLLAPPVTLWLIDTYGYPIPVAVAATLLATLALDNLFRLMYLERRLNAAVTLLLAAYPAPSGKPPPASASTTGDTDDPRI